MPTRMLAGVLTVAIASSGLAAPAAADPLRRSASPGHAGPAAAVTAWGVQAPSPPRRDPLWNGLLIGAALGLLAIVTTAAEAPSSGKVTTVVMLAGTGAFIDWRMSIAHGLPTPAQGRRNPRLVVRRALRF